MVRDSLSGSAGRQIWLPRSCFTQPRTSHVFCLSIPIAALKETPRIFSPLRLKRQKCVAGAIQIVQPTTLAPRVPYHNRQRIWRWSRYDLFAHHCHCFHLIGKKDTVNKIILDPQYADFLALVKAMRNGAVYGAKVRFPHALV